MYIYRDDAYAYASLGEKISGRLVPLAKRILWYAYAGETRMQLSMAGT